jgi:aldehyde:ferredoxin oxidoreductase
MALDYGWVGKILVIDLSTRKVETVPTSNYVPKFVGGRALAAKLYWDEVPPECGAFDPENSLIFSTGPAAGTPGAGSARTAVATKASDTMPECYMYSVTGGHWGAELKYAGFDAVVVRGKASEPAYIWINDAEVKILKANRLWGMTISQTDTEIRKLWGDKTRVMLIGPAGENLVRSSIIVNDISHATGLGGFGAVMGSKNLKAIAVRGTGGVKVARPKDLLSFYDENVKIGGKYGGPYCISSEAYNTFHGTENLVALGVPQEQIGKETEDMDTRFNNVDSYWVKYYLAHDEVMAGTIRSKFEGCFACPACCGLALQSEDPTGDEKSPNNLSTSMTVGNQCHEYPYYNEFEAVQFGGKRLGRPSILNQSYHQEMGTTTSDMGYHYFWFLEAVKSGLLTKENTGLPIGDYNSAQFMGANGWTVGITYRRNDFFKRLAEGQQRFLAGMAKESPAWKELYERYIWKPNYYTDNWIGTASDALGMLIGATNYRKISNGPLGQFTGTGKQLDGFMPKAESSKAVPAVRAKYAALLGDKSFDLPGEPKTFEGKVAAAIFLQNMHVEMDSMTYCGWMGFPRFYSLWTPDHVGDPSVGVKMLAAITGIDRTMEENVQSFEAVWTLERAIRVREGQRKEHDMYLDSFFAKTTWTSKDEFSKALSEYYKARGWAVDTGIPTRSQLEKLGMRDVADDLETKYGVQVPA